MKDFVHLHVHTEYSLLDGIARIVDNTGAPGDLIKTAQANSMKALAITDHGNMFGVPEFYLTCREAKIKPVLGCEFYVSQGDSADIKSPVARKNFHLTILAKNDIGFGNLTRLASFAYTKGFYYRPRIDITALSGYREGLIVLSGCLQGKIPGCLLAGDFDGALAYAKKMKDLFGEDFYIELMDAGLAGQKKIIPSLVEIARRLDLKTVATNDVHYSKKEDAGIQDAAMTIGTRMTLADPKRLHFGTQEFYLKSAEEMAEIFSEIPQALLTTCEIAEKCSVTLEFNQLRLPAFTPPAGKNLFSYLKEICEKGVKKRYGGITADVKNRLNTELAIIKKMGFSSYFLIVWDFINFARENKISVGPGRGSGAGSIVAYLLGITGIDPLKYNLLFERFLNPGRITMPDLDIDFEDTRREEVIDYVKNKYGRDSVGQIITFNKMLAKGAVRDVGRVMEIPLQKCDKIAKLIPYGETIHGALEEISEIKKMAHQDASVAGMLRTAGRIEGLKRHFGVHAAGIVIAPGEISQFVPLARSKFGIITQYEGDYLTKLGLLKMDFLGLKTLSVINDAVALIYKNKKIKIDIEKIPLDDKRTFGLLDKAKTIGVFQVESEGMRDILRKMRPTVFTDLSAVLALYRPGPMRAGMVDEFIERKHGRKPYDYPHPALKKILAETYGVILYQEQVMLVASELAGFTLEQADILRKAMGKKIMAEIEEQKDNFVNGCGKNGVKADTAEEIFNLLVHFAAYGFNKSHSTAYAVISYRTAYLKANYPLEFMVALLNSQIADEKKISHYLNGAKSMGLVIIPPDINESGVYFEARGEKEILFGLLAIKNTGEKACEDLVRERDKNGRFKDLNDFLIRDTGLQTFNKRMVEFLVKAGCFSGITPGISDIVEKLETLIASADTARQDKISGQRTLFESAPHPIKAAPSSETQKLKYEKEALGFYLTGHPLARYEKFFRQLRTSTLAGLKASPYPEQILTGIVKEIKNTRTKKGKEMFVIKFEDLTGVIEVIGFKKSLPPDLPGISEDDIIVLKGSLSEGISGMRFLGEKFYSVAGAFEKLPKALSVFLNTSGLEESFVKNIASLLKKYPGGTSVKFILNTKTGKKWKWGAELKVKINAKLLNKLEGLLGEDCWKIEV
ncbi:MAG: DNA polymerase III subunit alpha [bacterium]